MYIIVFSVLVGSIIGAFTNALAIKMLFRPFKPWYIGKWQVPFTPGVIPKRQSEIAEKLGHMVEKYLFTSDGLRQFMDRAGLKEQLNKRFKENWKSYLNQYQTVGELLTVFFTEEWRSKLKILSKKQIHNALSTQSLKEKTLSDLLSDDMLLQVEARAKSISKMFVQDLGDYLHSDVGRAWLQSIVDQLIGGKKMLGFLSAFIDSEQILQKLVQYLEQILTKPETEQVFTDFILKEWDNLKDKPIGYILEELDKEIQNDSLDFVAKSITYISDVPISKIIEPIEQNELDDKLYEKIFSYVQNRLDSFFAYLSISEVVREEVNRFSFEELEKMIIEIANRELKMITYFGGVLGGFLGLIQGVIYFAL